MLDKMPDPRSSHLIYGYFYEIDGSTGYSKTPVYLLNKTQGEIIETTTDGSGRYIFDCYNFTTWANGDELIVIGASELYTRRIISSLTIGTDRDYRFTVTLELSDNSIGLATFVDNGMNEIRDWMGAATATAPSHIEWNDATGTPAETDDQSNWDTGGGNEQRNAIGSKGRSPSTVVKYTTVLTTAQLDGVTISKSGIFNASTGATLIAQTKYAGVVKNTLFGVIEVDQINIVS